MATVIAEPPANSMERRLCASGTSSITPFRRTRPPRRPSRKDSAIVRAVPGLTCAPASNARTSRVASGSASLSTEARQSVGMTSNPDARADHDSGGLRIRVPALRGEKNVEFAGDIEIMGAAREASVDYLRAGG